MKGKANSVLQLGARLREHNECFDGKVPEYVRASPSAILEQLLR